MLSITSKSPYALRALAELARSGGDGTVPIGELARRRITVLEIVELLDGKLGAGAESIFGEAAEAARAVLAGSTIADVVERENRDAGATMYYI